MARFLMTLIGESVGELYGLRSSLSRLRMVTDDAGGRHSYWPSRVPGRCLWAFLGSQSHVTCSGIGLEPHLGFRAGRWFPGAAAVVAGSLAGTLFLSTIPSVEGIPWGGYGAALCVLIGGTAIGPLLFNLFRRTQPSSGATERWGLWPSLAADQMTRHVGRTSVTLSAIVVGLSIMVGVGLMIHGFRQTVQLWIDQTDSTRISSWLPLPGWVKMNGEKAFL
ncbi:MAG: hypothetical protein R3B74_17420 [Nitrospirales bacterium]|nr:hypothetical protein [Nitrospirales bacterium]